MVRKLICISAQWTGISAIVYDTIKKEASPRCVQDLPDG